MKNHPKNLDEALNIRDSFAKILYNDLFKWIFTKISLFSQAQKQSVSLISLIDMFGYEVLFLNFFFNFYLEI